jgi:flavin reductase (DIM6/NTAB) family NADH-FMN oxidoreductase RutF
LAEAIESGTHTIFVGDVRAAAVATRGSPLIYEGGGFHALAAPKPARATKKAKSQK